MSHIIRLFLLLVCGTAIHCQSPVNNQKQTLFADYYVRYLQAEKQLRAEATFMTGDSLQNAESTRFKAVFFQGGAMDERNLRERGIKYRSDRNGDYTSPFEFKLDQESGDAGIQSFNMSPVESFQFESDVSLSNKNQIVWTGEKLNDQESLVIMFTDKNNKASFVNISGPTNSPAAEFMPAPLESLTSGPGTVYLVKKQISQKVSSTQQISATIEYYTAAIPIEITE